MNKADPLYSSFIVNCVFNAFSADTAIMLCILTIHAMRTENVVFTKTFVKTLLLSLVVSDLGAGLLARPLYVAEMVNQTDF